ncbi:MAG: tetrahydromethanopterin-linked C1 transfer pathway [Pirellulaceae bacterium]|nr:MAG: tetrahydromethanopterin-linked C1 transfer pathway [Pirellulaceae bacterium]
MRWLGLDVGGANIKVADGQGYAARYSFALWREPELLAGKLRTALAEAPPADRIALTMTGELADCFATRSEGVCHIMDAVEQAAAGRPLRVYLVDGRFVAPAVARDEPLKAAASNWHALAQWAAHWVPEGQGLLIDIGSTTTDLVPLRDGRVDTRLVTDTERLIAGELVYTGVERSPICGLVQRLPYRGRECPVMHEWFATTLDVYLLLGEIKESPTARHTADGRPATKAAARIRLARMIGYPEPQFHHRDAVQIARHVAQAQEERLAEALRQVIARLQEPVRVVVLSGQGEFLARRVLARVGLECRVISLTAELGMSVSAAAPAHAVAVLAQRTTSPTLPVPGSA